MEYILFSGAGALILFIITVVGITAFDKSKKTLPEPKTYIPIEELASEFRSFIESINGKLTKEDEDFIKQLEGHKSNTKLLTTNSQKRPVMGDEAYNLMCQDWKVEDHDYKSMFERVIKRWGSKYIFTLKQQQAFIDCWKGTGNAKSREHLRAYFDQYHNNT